MVTYETITAVLTTLTVGHEGMPVATLSICVCGHDSSRPGADQSAFFVLVLTYRSAWKKYTTQGGRGSQVHREAYALRGSYPVFVFFRMSLGFFILASRGI